MTPGPDLPKRPMNAIVTGCAGFIGSHLTERLITDGWNVTGIDALTDYYDVREKLANLAELERLPGFTSITADLLHLNLEEVFTGHDVVFHLAGQPGVRGSFGPGFADYVRLNVIATQLVFEAAMKVGTKRVVYASSSSVYGDAETYPCVEQTTSPRPRSPYGVTKHTCEDIADVYRRLGIPSVGLRYFTVYGPRQRPDMAMRRLCEAAHGGPRFVMYGDGLQSRDFTHVSDAVDATVRSATAPNVPPVLNIGGGNEAGMRHIVAAIELLTGSTLSIEFAPAQKGDVRRTGADTTLARERLGWSPSVSLIDGLASELEWVARRLGAASRQPVQVGL